MSNLHLDDFKDFFNEVKEDASDNLTDSSTKREIVKQGMKAFGRTFRRAVLYQIALHPCISGTILLLLLVGIIYLWQSFDATATELMIQYQSLTNQTTSSKVNYDKRITYIQVDDDGNMSTMSIYQSDLIPEKEIVSFINNNFAVSLPSDAKEVQSILSQQGSPVSSELAEVSGIIWSIINPVYGKNAAVGFLANIKAEGLVGMIEKDWLSNSTKGNATLYKKQGGSYISIGTLKSQSSWYYYDSVTNHYYVTYDGIKGLSQTLYWDEGGNKKEAAIGVGLCQWSYERRKELMKQYLNVLSENGITQNCPNFSQQYKGLLVTAEAQHMKSEIGSSGSRHSAMENCVSQLSAYSGMDDFIARGTISEWAEAICDGFEAPGGSCYGESVDDVTGDIPMQYVINGNSLSGRIGSWACRLRVENAEKIASYLNEKMVK